jgi:hypothetical protein
MVTVRVETVAARDFTRGCPWNLLERVRSWMRSHWLRNLLAIKSTLIVLSGGLLAAMTPKSSSPKKKPDYEIIPSTSDVCMCVILHGKASEVTLLLSLLQEAHQRRHAFHRRRYACVVVSVGRIIVNMHVD